MYRELWNASIVLLLLGGLFAAAGGVFRLLAQKKEPYSAHAEARVVEIVPVPWKGASSLPEFHNRLSAVFEFYADGRPVKVTDASDTYPCPYRLNERVKLCYNPENPQEYRIEKKDKWQILALHCRILSMLLVLGGCTLFLLYAGRVGRG